MLLTNSSRNEFLIVAGSCGDDEFVDDADVAADVEECVAAVGVDGEVCVGEGREVVPAISVDPFFCELLLDDELSSLPSAIFGEPGKASSSPDDETRKLDDSASFATIGEGTGIGESLPIDDLLFWLLVI